MRCSRTARISASGARARKSSTGAASGSGFRRSRLHSGFGPALTARAEPRAADEPDKSCADFMTEPPYHLIIALLGQVVSASQENKVVGNVETIDVKSHAASRNIGDDAIARQPPVAEVDFRHAIDETPRRLAPIGRIC